MIVDSDRTVGGVWSSERLYPNLVAQVKLGLFNYTDTPMPRQGATESELVTGNMIHDYLQKYAEDHDLLRRIRFDAPVQHAERCSLGWSLSFGNSTDTVETERLMVATGVTSIPNMPHFKKDEVSVPVIHSKQLGSSFNVLRTNSIKHVVVVGAAKSAYDAVYLLLSMGKKVTWIIRPDGAGPLAILPTELFGFLNSIAVASTRLMTYLSPSILNTSSPLCSFFQKNILGRWLTRKFWDTVTFLSNRHAGYARGDHVSMLRPEVDGKRLLFPSKTLATHSQTNNCSVFWANSGLGVVTLPDFWSTIHAGDVTVLRDNVDAVKQNTAILRSGQTVQTDYIIMCTGWGDHFSMFDAPTKVELGLPAVGETPRSHTESSDDLWWAKFDIAAEKEVNSKLPMLAKPPGLRSPQANNGQARGRWALYRRVIPLSLAEKGDRSLAIMGQIHTVQTPLVAEMQSFWAIIYLLGEIDLPDHDTMAREIAEWNAWTRKRYLSQGQKFPYSLYDFLPVSLLARSPPLSRSLFTQSRVLRLPLPF